MSIAQPLSGRPTKKYYFSDLNGLENFYLVISPQIPRNKAPPNKDTKTAGMVITVKEFEPPK